MQLAIDKGSSYHANIVGPLFQSISQRLAPLENSRYLHITYSPARQICIELPRMKLSFFINDELDLESHNLRNQVIDENQSSGTMLGLQNQLLLRAKEPITQSLPQSRTVLIPHGAVSFSTSENHVSVKVDPGSDRQVAFHQYKVDSGLRYLAVSTGLTSRLFKIYLHAVTSHCLPDPLTGRTGTEEALYELSEPATSSFDQITKEQAKLLMLIGSLTPVREYYPRHLQSMQTVHWANLSPLSQHYAFVTAVESVLRRADILRLFHPLEFKPMAYAAVLEPTLLERAARRSHMYYPPEITARLPTILDGVDDGIQAYTGRDCNLTEKAEAEHATTWATSLVYARWNQPTYTSCDLVSQMEPLKDLEGPCDDLGLTYSSSWLEIDLAASWLSIYNLCRRANSTGNRYQLLVCLASAAYSRRLPEGLLLVLLAFATNRSFRDIAPPNHPSYQLADRYEPNSDRVEELVSNFAKDFADSPAGNLSILEDESEHDLRLRQHRYHKSQVSLWKSQFATHVIAQWPNTRPQCSGVSFTSWLKIQPALAAVYKYFASCSRNSELRAHFEVLQTTLDSQTLTPGLDIPTPPATSNESHPQHQPAADQFTALRIEDLLGSRACPDPGDYLLQSNICVMQKKGDSVDTSRLASLIAELQSSHTHVLRMYGKTLETSRNHLTEAKVVILPPNLPRLKILIENRHTCRRYMRNIYTEISKSLGPLTTAQRVISTAGIWPRSTPRAILRRLSLWGRGSLSEGWRDVLSKYAQTVLDYQSAQRLIGLAHADKREEFLKELDLEGTRSSEISYDPDWLLVQVSKDHKLK